MRQCGLPALVNPFGVLYNPQSIMQVLTADLMSDQYYFCDDTGRWHCWLADSSKNASTLEACKAAMVSARGRLFEWNPDTVVVTLGTNRCYELALSGLTVGNCHKQPHATFRERDLSVAEVVTALRHICDVLPRTRFMLTVSPYRYAKYGFHESRLAKAALLLAVEQLRQQRDTQVTYFPAYEIMLDELRDYRFYAADMLHPSDQAIDYIWERFAQHCLDTEAHRYLVDYEPIRRAMAHRPSDPDSAEAQLFRQQTQEHLMALLAKYNIEL